MNSPFNGTAFVLMWVGFLVIMSSGIVIFFMWAVRARQFCDQERARSLPLNSGIPPQDAPGESPSLSQEGDSPTSPPADREC